MLVIQNERCRFKIEIRNGRNDNCKKYRHNEMPVGPTSDFYGFLKQRKNE